MNEAPLSLGADAAVRWAACVGRALDTLRLNRHFPPWDRVAAHLAVAAETVGRGALRLDRNSALPVPREWLRVGVEAQLGVAAARRAALMPAFDVHVALRSHTTDRASYAVTVDRLDLGSATVARYSLMVSDRPGKLANVGELALQAAERFRERLSLLTSQDAALAFVVLREEGMEVEEVVRGLIGPGAVTAGDPLLPAGDPGCGPPALRSLGLGAPLMSACLERASVALPQIVLDDPLGEHVMLPTQHGRFGLSRVRKWAVAEGDLPVLQRWVQEQGSRGLVSGYRTPRAAPRAASRRRP